MSTELRVGAPEETILSTQSNLVRTYEELGQYESALSLQRDVYSRRLKLSGEDGEYTLIVANNYADCLNRLRRFEEAKSVLCKTMPVAQRVLGEHILTIKMRIVYAYALYGDSDATLDDLREAVTTLEETSRTARRVLGGAHPITGVIERSLEEARLTLARALAKSARGPRTGL